MSPSQVARIDRLIDQVLAAVDSPQNRRRQARPRKCLFQIEEPITWLIMYGFDVETYFNDPWFYVEQTLRQKLWRWETFPEDHMPITAEIPAWLSHYPEFTYAGMTVRFSARGVPELQDDHPLSQDPDLRHLRPLDFTTSGWMPRVLRWHEAISSIVAGRLKVPFMMTWWRGCLDLAIQLRGYHNFITDIMVRPEFIHDLLRMLTEQRCRWHEAYCQHFGVKLEPANIGDDWINVPFISPAIFADFVLPRYLEIERFHGGIAYIHSCGNQTPVQQYLLQLQSLPILELGPWSDWPESLRNIPPDKQLMPFLHPNDVLCASDDAMEARLRGIAQLLAGRDYPNIGTSGLTPIHDDVASMIDRIKAWTRIATRICDQDDGRGISPVPPGTIEQTNEMVESKQSW